MGRGQEMLAIFLSPLGRWLLMAGLSAALIVAAYAKGRMDRARLDESAALRATVASLTEQLKQTKAVADAAAARADLREQERTDIARKVSDYEAELAKRGADCGCVLDEHHARRLRDIIGPVPPLPPRRP